jgi:hypothetical protein
VGIGGGALLLIAGIAVAVVLLLPKKDKDKGGDSPKGTVADKPKVHDSPQACYDACQAARKRKDYKGMLACYTPKARRDTAAAVGYMFSALRLLAPDDPQELAALWAVLDKHGLTRETVRKVIGRPRVDLAKPQFTPREKEIIVEDGQICLGLIKDPEAFVSDAFAVLFELDGPAREEETLEDVQINGDKATAKEVVKAKGRSNPIEFTKVDGGWLISKD